MAMGEQLWILILGLSACCWQYCDCICTFPSSLRGDFVTSVSSAYLNSFNATTVEGFDFVAIGTSYRLVYDCHAQSGSTYLLKSQETRNILDIFYIYRCILLIQSTDDIYYFYYTLPYLTDAKDYLKYDKATTLTTAVCTESTAGIDTMPHILLQSSAISTASTTCPNVFLGKYSYDAVDTSSATVCTAADMDSCVDKTVTAFNKTSCATDVSYSANGDLNCGASFAKSGVTYIYTINPEASVNYGTTQRFLCFALKQSGNTVVGTVATGECAANQTEADNGVYTLVFTPNTSIVDATDPTNGGFPIAAIGAVIAILVIAAIAGVVGYFIWKNRKGSKVADIAKKDGSEKKAPEKENLDKAKESNNNSTANGDAKPKEDAKPNGDAKPKEDAKPNGDAKPKEADKAL